MPTTYQALFIYPHLIPIIFKDRPYYLPCYLWEYWGSKKLKNYVLPPIWGRSQSDLRSIWFHSPATSWQFVYVTVVLQSLPHWVIKHVLVQRKYLSKILRMFLFLVQLKPSFNPIGDAAALGAPVRLDGRVRIHFPSGLDGISEVFDNKRLLCKSGHK